MIINRRLIIFTKFNDLFFYTCLLFGYKFLDVYKKTFDKLRFIIESIYHILIHMYIYIRYISYFMINTMLATDL